MRTTNGPSPAPGPDNVWCTLGTCGQSAIDLVALWIHLYHVSIVLEYAGSYRETKICAFHTTGMAHRTRSHHGNRSPQRWDIGCGNCAHYYHRTCYSALLSNRIE